MVGRRFSIHLIAWVVGVAVLRVAAVPAEVCPAVNAGQVRSAMDATVDWFARGIADDGRYTYGYDRDSDAVNAGYNEARHAGVTMSLYQVYGAHGGDQLLDLADSGTGFMLDRVRRWPDRLAFASGSGDVALGANSLMLAALALRREVTGEPVHDDVMRGLGRFIVGQQQRDGAMLAYWRPGTGLPVPGLHGKFATGEAAWALMLLDRELPGEGWAEAGAFTVDYLAERRDRAEGQITRLPDHWAAYAIADMPSEMRRTSRLDYARVLAGFFGVRLRFEAQRRGSGVNLAVRWHPGPPAGVGTAGEGLGALLRLSRDSAQLADLTTSIEERLVCTAGFMVERQADAAKALGYGRPDLVEGAWFYRGYSQMDDQQHVLSTLLAALPVIERMEAEV